MRFYTATRTIYKSPVHKYFNAIEELNTYYEIDSTIDDYNNGYTFWYKNQPYTLNFED